MKLRTILLFAFFILAIGFRAKAEHQEYLEYLESIVFRKPDSVLAALGNLQHSELSKTEKEKATILTAMGYDYSKQKDTALVIYNSIIAKAEAISDQLVLADAYLGAATILERKGNTKEAKNLNQKAIKIGMAIQDNSVLNVAYNNLGYIHVFSDAYDSAAYYFEKAYESNRIRKDTLRMASCKNNMFVAYYRLGNFEKSAASLLESLQLKEKHSDPESYVSGLSNLFDLYLKIDDFDKARKTYLKALPLSQQNKLHDLEATLHSNMAVVLRNEGNLDSALVLHQQALVIYDSIGLETKKGLSLKNIGVVYSNMGKKEEALKYALQALEILEKQSSLRTLGLTNTNIALLYMDLNKTSKARPYIHAALDACKTVSDYELNQQTYKAQARYLEATKQYAKALKAYQTFKAYDDSLNSAASEKIIHQLEAKYQSEKKEAEIQNLTDKNRINELEIAKQNSTIKQQRTLTFTILISILLVAIFVYFLFVRYRLKQKNLQYQLNQQRMEIEQRMLRSQMNPHFIYNSLNSVQSYITTKRYLEAIDYLQKFSSLSRLILENSRHEYVALEQEIESLRLYTQIEQMKYQNKFEFEIIDETNEAEFIAVPPMMLQPFVENSIKHGLLPLDKTGKLTILYSIDNDILTCSVTDNGIGREESQRRKQKDSQHNSLALKLLSERIAIMKKEWNPLVNLIIKDFDLLNNGKTGTQTILTLPVKDL